MLQLLFAGSTSACFEILGSTPYYAPDSYTVYLDGEQVCEGNSNVFSVFGLTPDHVYEVSVCFASNEAGTPDGSLEFRTAGESCAVDVKAFGAVGDGSADDTAAIQMAINFLPSGGRLHFSRGTYLTLPLALKSHITLEFAEGATLLGSTDRQRYPIVPAFVPDLDGGEEINTGGFEGLALPMYQSLLTAEFAEDITIVGPGTVDGNAQNSDFWVGFKEFPAARPRLVFLNRCRDVVIHGITGKNSASWQFHPYYSDNISFYDVYTEAPKDSPNTDAIDPEACDLVNIIGCRFSVGDDCIAIKSGKIEMGMRYKRAASRHTIRNCLMQFGHGAVTLGSEIAAGVRDLTVSQCYFRDTDRGLRIKTRRGRGEGCQINNVVFDNIRMDGVFTPVVINMWYNCCDPDRFSEYVWSREKLPVDERTPHLGSFHFKNLTCTNTHAAACYIDGLPEMPIDEVTLENVTVSFAEDAQPFVPAMQNFAEKRCRLGLYLDNVRRVSVKNVTVTGAEGEWLIANNCGEVITE